MAIWYKLWQLGTVCGHLVYFSHFGMFWPTKIWQPWGGAPVKVARKVASAERELAPRFPAKSVFPFRRASVTQGCQIFLGKTYQNGNYVPNRRKTYQIVVKYSKGPQNIPKLPRPSKIYPSFQSPPKYTQIRISCMKIYHLATLVWPLLWKKSWERFFCVWSFLAVDMNNRFGNITAIRY
jgi:hypothetical protein